MPVGIVTGASRGLGFALVSALAERGWRLVVDARFLPNPFWIPELRHLDGEDAEVSEYVLDQPGAREFIDAYATALEPVMAGYKRENKRHATIAVGCTGGRHRSVAIVRELADRLRQLPGVVVNVKHRDRGRE